MTLTFKEKKMVVPKNDVQNPHSGRGGNGGKVEGVARW